MVKKSSNNHSNNNNNKCHAVNSIAILVICLAAIFSTSKFLNGLTDTLVSTNGSRNALLVASTGMAMGGGGASLSSSSGSTGTSGSLFQMKKLRDATQVPGYKLIFQHQHSQSGGDDKSDITANKHDMLSELWPEAEFWNPTHLNCKNWGAMTTIFPVTEAAAYIAKLPGWCLVVAGDLKGPESYNIDDGSDVEGSNTGKAQIVFLSAERQRELEDHLSFVQRTPWNHFSRKNIAFLYAIANGAEYIWDFDDDNILWPSKEQLLTEIYTLAKNSPLRLRTLVIQVDNVDNVACRTFNPYKAFQSSSPIIWPRGYPLEDMHKPECQTQKSYCHRRVPSERIGIYQSIADGDPDVDAIYRLTQELPVHFEGTYDQDIPVIVPPHTMSPMNAQATLIKRSAMWSMFLPTTVHGRVSDIWRSYIAQALGNQYGMLSVFMGPIVTQDRNAHNYLADFQSEEPLYERAGVFIEYLLNWKYESGQTFEGAMEQLYVDLYEHNIIEWDDVLLVQLWLQTLQSIGYEFPSLSAISDANPAAILEETCEEPHTIPSSSAASGTKAEMMTPSSSSPTKKKKKTSTTTKKKPYSSLIRKKVKDESASVDQNERPGEDDNASDEQERSSGADDNASVEQEQSSGEEDNASVEQEQSSGEEDNASVEQGADSDDASSTTRIAKLQDEDSNSVEEEQI